MFGRKSGRECQDRGAYAHAARVVAWNGICYSKSDTEAGAGDVHERASNKAKKALQSAVN